MNIKEIFELISEDEFMSILMMLPRDAVIDPLKSKKFKTYTHGFRVQNLPNSRIEKAYIDNVINKKDLELCNYITRAIVLYIENIKETMNEHSKKILKSNKVSTQDIDKLFEQFAKHNIDFDLSIFIKLNKIDINSELSNYASKKQQEYKMMQNLREEISKGLQSEFKEKLNLQEKSIEEKYKNKYINIKTKYENDMKEQHDKFYKKINELENNISILSDENSELNSLVEKKEKEIVKLEYKIESKDQAIKEYDEKLKQLDNKMKNIQDEKRKTLNELDSIKKLRVKEMINDIDMVKLFDNFKDNDNFERKFGEYIDSNIKDENDSDILQYWINWNEKEKHIITEFMELLLLKDKLDIDQVDKLVDLEFTFKLRLILIRLFQSLVYKYLSSQTYEEIFI